VTKTPWTFDEVWHLIKGKDGEEICALHSADPMHGKRAPLGTAIENAEYIIQSVNNHAALMRAAKMGLEVIERKLTRKEINERREIIINALDLGR
jgi:diphthamide synthase (EF-2-diphthine--ammonia ligase)